MNAGRIIVNTPSSQGAVGEFFNTLNPALTMAAEQAARISPRKIFRHPPHQYPADCPPASSYNWTRFDIDRYLDEDFTTKELQIEYYKNT
jgi:hypothetical protein